MRTPRHPALFVVTAMLENWVNQGPATVHWAAVRQPAPEAMPLAGVVSSDGPLDPMTRSRVVQAISRCFTGDEVRMVTQMLAHANLGSPMSLRCESVTLPIPAGDLLDLQDPNPFAARTLWRVKPPMPPGAGDALEVEGIVTLWPWGAPAPAERKSGTVLTGSTWHA
ncbi:MAG: hypothetical protein QM692_22260 [Thermomicrobiales bacterium]